MYAVGDVIGPPGLASSAQMGGRAVASLLFAHKMERLRQYMLDTSTEIEVIEPGWPRGFCFRSGYSFPLPFMLTSIYQYILV